MDIQKLLKDFAHTRKLSGTILVALDNVPVCSANFGFADQSTNSTCSLSTQYLIASITTKQFTAVSVLRALYDKALANTKDMSLIDQKVQEDLHHPLDYFMSQDHEIWLGRMPTWASKVSAHHLLTHSSGLPNR